MPKTKIVATLGPASDTYRVLVKMVREGLDVARLNFSHGTHEAHLKKINLIRKINQNIRSRVRIMQDLEGFRIRVCTFKKGGQKILTRGKTVWFTKDADTGDPRVIPFDYKGDLKKIGKGQPLYIDDGNIILKVTGATGKTVKAEVIEGGLLKERKGINMPGVRIPFAGVTDKDRNDLEFGIKHKVDYVSQSFVRTRGDIDTIKERLKERSSKAKVIAKIESREAIKNIDSIIDASDGIMVARGDMGTAVPIYEIAIIQKMIIKKCNRKRKFVITATQMLEHMTEHSRPTRAEVTDVTNAILDGTDFVMLSEESAAGKYPVKSVRMMENIIKFTEKHQKTLARLK